MNFKRPRLNRDMAETFALQGLAFLASDPDRLTRFMTLTGADPADLRGFSGDGALQASVLDYLLQDESLLLVFTSSNGIDPALVSPAHHLLTGAQPSEA
ncbi:MAG: DUF3572 domain-containing protein [Hyphomicrobium sp.]